MIPYSHRAATHPLCFSVCPVTTPQPTSLSSPLSPASTPWALTSVHVCEQTLGRMGGDHVRRCDSDLMVILAFGKNGTVGVIRRGAIRAAHMTACLCLSPPRQCQQLPVILSLSRLWLRPRHSLHLGSCFSSIFI